MKLGALSPRTPSSLRSSIQANYQDGGDISLVKLREGFRGHWYPDSLGKTTGGYGHLKLANDPAIFDQGMADVWLENDLGKARKAATTQLNLLPIQTQALYDVLVSVNFQLGTAWFKTFKNTWSLMLKGEYAKAAIEAQDSAWFRQTPVRVKDFQKALNQAALLAKQYADLGL